MFDLSIKETSPCVWRLGLPLRRSDASSDSSIAIHREKTIQKALGHFFFSRLTGSMALSLFLLEKPSGKKESRPFPSSAQPSRFPESSPLSDDGTRERFRSPRGGAAEGGHAPGKGPGLREVGSLPAGDGHTPEKGHAFGRFGLSRVLLIVIPAISVTGRRSPVGFLLGRA